MLLPLLLYYASMQPQTGAGASEALAMHDLALVVERSYIKFNGSYMTQVLFLS